MVEQRPACEPPAANKTGLLSLLEILLDGDAAWLIAERVGNDLRKLILQRERQGLHRLDGLLGEATRALDLRNYYPPITRTAPASLLSKPEAASTRVIREQGAW